MTTDDERARKIAEAKARAEAARAARMGGQQTGSEAPAEPPSTPPQPEAEQPAAPASPEPVAAQAQEAAQPAATDGADERARRIAEAKARAEAARAAREGGAAPADQPGAPAPVEEAPVAAAAAAPSGSTDERARRIEEAKARAAAARAASGGGATPAAQPAAPAAATPAAPAARPAAAAPAASMAPAEDWKGVAAAPARVLTARAESRAVVRREMRAQEVRNLYTRRSLVRTSFWAALGVTVTGLLLGFLNFFWPREVTGFGGIIKIPASQVPAQGTNPKAFPDMKGYIVNLQPGGGVPPQFQTLAAPSQNGGILALWWKCPHLGCTVPWRPEFDFEGVKGWFRCPCHGSTYTQAGIRVFGPAPRPMDTFAVKVNADGSLDVDTSEITPGSTDNPQRAVLA